MGAPPRDTGLEAVEASLMPPSAATCDSHHSFNAAKRF
jgi:hypothetical protein